MQYDMDVGGDAVPRRYLARVMAQPQRATVWGVRIRSVTPAASVRTLWLETWALPHRARLSSSSPVRTMGRLLHLVTGPTRLGAFPTSMRKHPPEACTAGGGSSGARAIPRINTHTCDGRHCIIHLRPFLETPHNAPCTSWTMHIHPQRAEGGCGFHARERAERGRER